MSTKQAAPISWDAHDAAFGNVSAYVILHQPTNGAVNAFDVVAKVALKFGAAVTCHLHVLGNPVFAGRAGGGGYDRQSAAVADAARKFHGNAPGDDQVLVAFLTALRANDGARWDDAAQRAGFHVIQAV